MIPKCKNCQLYDKKNSVCQTQVVVQGEIYKLPVKPEDECHWIRIDLEVQKEIEDAIKTSPKNASAKEIRKKLMEEVDVPISVKEVKFWSDGKNGFMEERG
jgi:hypothetical protein